MDEKEKKEEILIKYHNKNSFSTYIRENETDEFPKLITENIEVLVNPENKNELIMRT